MKEETVKVVMKGLGFNHSLEESDDASLYFRKMLEYGDTRDILDNSDADDYVKKNVTVHNIEVSILFDIETCDPEVCGIAVDYQEHDLLFADLLAGMEIMKHYDELLTKYEFEFCSGYDHSHCC